MQPLIDAQTYKRVNNFDLIRLGLALMVVFFHIYKLSTGNTGMWLSYLVDFAVSSFFVISGLLVTRSFDQDQRLSGYLKKRFLRIYPLYFTMILTQLCILLILTSSAFNSQLLVVGLKYFVCNIIFLNFLQPTIPGVFEHLKYNAINGSLWTIKIEVLFYILLPLIYYGFKKFRISFLISLYFLSALFAGFSVSNPVLAVLADQLPAQLRFFVVGIVFYLYGYKIKLPALFMLLIPVGLFIANYFCIGNIVYKTALYPICLGFIVYLTGFSKPLLKLKYDISYGVYLIHFPVIQLLLFFGFAAGNFSLFMLTGLVTVVLLALLSFIFLEKKFIELGHRLTAKRVIYDGAH